MNNIIEYLKNAELALAAYSDLSVGTPSIDKLKDNGKGMSPLQAADFASKWTVVNSYTDPITGVSATVFQEIATGQKTLAIRGTQGATDYLADYFILNGTPSQLNPQYLLLKAKVQTWLGDGTLTPGFTVSGHSLGGYLAAGLVADFSTSISHAYLYNAPGNNSLISQVMQALGIAATPDSAKLTSLRADAGISPIAALGYDFAPPLAIYIENQFDLNLLPTAPAALNHSQQVLVDSLAVYNLFAKVDPAISVGTITAILQASTNSTANTLEAALAALGGIYGKNYFGGQATRDTFYTNLYDLQGAMGTGGTLVSLTTKSASDITTQAQTDIAYRYALKELNPFAITGLDYSNRNVTGDLNRYDAATGAGNLTDLYLADRAAMLTWKIKYDTGQKDEDDLILLGDKAYNDKWDTWKIKDDWKFIDVSRTLTLTIDGVGSDVHSIAFGGITNDALTGGSVADHLYGGAGNDTLIGGAGNDWLEGQLDDDNLQGGDGRDTLIGGQGADILTGGTGADLLQGGLGNDTYLIEGADTILDADGSGKIMFKGTQLTGGKKLTAGSNTYTDAANNTYTLTGDATNGYTLLLNGGITIQNFHNNDLGILLENAAITSPAGPADRIITGDLAPIQFGPDADSSVTHYHYDDIGNIVVSPATPAPGRADTLYDSTGNDTIQGLSGSDTINAFRGGNDTIDGGAGQDYVDGGAGNDKISGGTENDILSGGTGDDWIYADQAGDAALAAALDPATLGTGLKGDWLTGGSGKDTLVGGAGNDVLAGSEGQDLLLGGAGDDNILGDSDYLTSSFDWSYSDSGNIRTFTPVTGATNPPGSAGDVIYAGAGNDHVWAGGGDDIVSGGLGADTLSGDEGNDTVSGDDGADRLWGQAGNDVLFGGEGDDRLEGDDSTTPVDQHGDDYLDGGMGVDVILGDGGNDTLLGGQGNDSLYGDADDIPLANQGNDYLDGGDGADYLRGYGGSDELLGGIGNDTIFGDAGSDTLKGGADNDLMFGDEDSVAPADQGNDLMDGDAGDDTLRGYGGNDTLYGSAGVDQLFGEEGNDYLDGGADNDWIQAGIGNDSLDGGAGLDTLFGEAGNDTLQGGAGNDQLDGGDNNDELTGGIGNDTMWGGNGDDVYVFNAGDGQDVLDDASGANKIRFGVGITKDALTVSESWLGGQYMTISYGGVDSVSIKSGFLGYIQTYAFADGSSMTHEELMKKLQTSVSIWGTASAEKIVGGGLRDSLYGGAGNDTLDGGADSDYLQGGTGNDTYLFGHGSGWDTIDSYDAGAGKVDTIQFTDLFQSDVTVSRNTYGDLILSVASTGDGLVVNRYFQLGGNQVERIKFADNSEWSYATVQALSLVPTEGSDYLIGDESSEVINGLGGNDSIYGAGGNDTIDGGAGNDELKGGDGNNVYLFGRGDGQDTIWPIGNDTVLFKSGIAPGDIKIARGYMDMLLQLKGSSEWVNIGNFFASDPSYYVTSIRFADAPATVWDVAYIKAMVTAATPGNDTFLGFNSADILDGLGGNDYIDGMGGNDQISGSDGNDTLYGSAGNDTLLGGAGADSLDGGNDNDELGGGAGNDTITGGAGNDTYVFGRGDGNDVVYNVDTGTGKVNTIRMKDDVLPSAVSLYRHGDDLVVVVDGSPTQMWVKDAFNASGYYRIDQILFKNGTTWNLTDINTKAVSGTINTMTGTAGNDTFLVDHPQDVINEAANQGTDTVESWVQYSLSTSPNVENLTLTGVLNINGAGNALNNVIRGNSGNNALATGGGYDTLYGGAGDDTLSSYGGGADMYGGTGDDTYLYYGGTVNEVAGEGTDTVVTYAYSTTLSANVENLTLLSDVYSIYATGNDLDNIIIGNNWTNFIDGGAGADTMIGSGGFYDNDDTYIVDNVGDVVRDSSGDNDKIKSYVSYTLPTGIESLILLGSGAISGTGNALNNTLDGTLNLSANVLAGGAGNDLYYFGSGDSVSENANEGTDKVFSSISYTLGVNVENLELLGSGAVNGTGNALDNYIQGNGGMNVLSGGDGNDTLNGGPDTPAWADTLIGGKGDDFYYQGNGGINFLDIITEYAGEGTDTVLSYVDYTLNSNIENLTLINYSTAVTGNGNELANTITGNDAANTLDGKDGNDTLVGGLGNDTLTGGLGADSLDGGAGADSMAGGVGDDTYVVDDAGDVLAENIGEGSDTVQSSVTYTLGTNFEKLTLTGTVAINGTGNDLANTLTGNNADNVLGGGLGADSLDGGLGDDQLSGGAGNDTYIIRPGEGYDVITDSAGNDSMHFGAGLNPSDILATQYYSAPNDLWLSVNAFPQDSGMVGITGWFQGNQIESFVFNGGLTLNAAEILEQPRGSYYNPDLFGYVAWGRTLSGFYFSSAGGSDGTLSGTEGDDILKGSGTAINGYGGNDSLIGQAGNDILNGGDGNDKLIGENGDDVLDGGLGVDTMYGGASDDTYVVDNVGDVVAENLTAGTDTVQSSLTYTLGSNVENLTLTGAIATNGTGNELNNVLTGNAADNILSGDAGNDTLLGGAGYDRLDGGDGADWLEGGADDDTYVVDNAGDVVVELIDSIDGSYYGGWWDTVESSITYILGDNIEYLTLTGTAAINGTGNALDNYLSGNSANNVLTGGAGYDYLDGGAGADTMAGGTEDDSYYVDNVGDVVTENGGEGNWDWVESKLSYTLGANVEALGLSYGAGAINGTGNAADNYLGGNESANILTGLAGNDTLAGGGGLDTLIGGTGDDTYYLYGYSSVVENASEGTDSVYFYSAAAGTTYTLAANVENATTWGYGLNLTGNDLNNRLTGDYGNNVLNGGAGADTLTGSGGNDTYVVDNAGDIVTENLNEGTDTVQSGITYTLGTNVENLTLTGTAAINGTDNTLNNLLSGNSGINTLTAGTGNDILQGGGGNDVLNDTAGNNLLNGGADMDTLTGGTGNEIFIGGTGNDTITTGQGTDLIAFNRGGGLDTINVSTVTDNTLSLGGGIQYTDLAFHKDGNNLVLDTGVSEGVVFKDWYAATTNHSFLTLQIIEEAAADFVAGGADSLRDNKIETFNFAGLADRFDQQPVSPVLTSWALTNALTEFHLSGSDTAALGGDLAYQYGKNGNLSNVGLTAAQSLLADAAFGTSAQALKPLASLQEGVVRLG